jgi:hypothetical protein
MSGTGWEWRDSGSTSGRMQQVVRTGTDGPVQAAYASFMEHATSCSACGYGATRCPRADALWAAWREAKQ